jgi:hypothetical protein
MALTASSTAALHPTDIPHGADEPGDRTISLGICTVRASRVA